MSFISYRPTTVTVAATTQTTYTFDDAVLPTGGISDFFITATGTNNSIGASTCGIDSARVKLNGVTQIDLTAAQLRALIEALAPSNSPPSTELRFPIPMSLPRFQLPGFPASIGIPAGVRTSVEILTNTSSSAGTFEIAWRGVNGTVQYVPKAIQSATNIAASTTNGRIELKTGTDLVVGFLLPIVGATGITRARIVQLINGRETQIFHGSQGAILGSQKLENPSSLITTSFFLRLPVAAVLPSGSYIEVDTGAGSAATDSYAPVALQTVIG